MVYYQLEAHAKTQPPNSMLFNTVRNPLLTYTAEAIIGSVKEQVRWLLKSIACELIHELRRS